jgi:hypothetical protein
VQNRIPLRTSRVARSNITGAGSAGPSRGDTSYTGKFGTFIRTLAYCGVGLPQIKQVSRIFGREHHNFVDVFNVLQSLSFERPHQYEAIAPRNTFLSRSAIAGYGFLLPSLRARSLIQRRVLHVSLALLLSKA